MRLDGIVREKYPNFVAGYVLATGVTVETEVEPLDNRLLSVLSEIKTKFAQAQVTEIPEIRAYREFFKLIGRDPSSFRPSVEYLLRKTLEDQFPRINNVVDSCMLASVEHMVSAGVYDLQKVVGELRTTLAAPDEKPIELIDGRKLQPLPGEVILKDDQKILSAYTLGDSKISKITYGTSSVIFVLWNAPGIPRENVERAVESLSLYARKYCGGYVDKKEVL